MRADKAARFMQLCNAHGLPLVSLCDTPGFMVGPEIEAQAQVRHVCRMFMVASHLRVPYFAVVLRKGYGLGAQAMTAGGFDAPVFTVAWPTGEFGAMGLEGAVRLGFRKELEAARRRRRTRCVVQEAGRAAVRQWRGHPHGANAGDRCCHRSGRYACLAGARARFGFDGAAPGHRVRRYLVGRGTKPRHTATQHFACGLHAIHMGQGG